MSRIEQSERRSLRRPKLPIKGGSAPEKEEEEEEEEEEKKRRRRDGWPMEQILFPYPEAFHFSAETSGARWQQVVHVQMGVNH